MKPFIGLCFVLALGALACGPKAPDAGGGGGAPPASPAGPLFEDREDLSLKSFRGRVVVMMLGCVGCEGTEAMYFALRDHRKAMKDGFEFVRVDYGQSLASNRAYYEEQPAGFHVIGDPTCKIGKTLPSQAMPTLFLVGKWGQIRFTGGLEEESFARMTEALKAETKPDPSNFFKEKRIDRGDVLIDFTLEDIGGIPFTVETYREGAKAFVLVFAGTACPTSRSGVRSLADWSVEFEVEGARFLAVNSEADAEATKKVYEEMGVPFPVLLDLDGKTAEMYAIDAVPTVFVTDADGKIALRSLWNPDAVRQEIEILLGRKSAQERQAFENQGTG